jgi:NADH:ubiquinone oxidoreductase subunit 4 (subunit M)
MNPELGQAWFRVAIFITLVSGILILVEPRDSAEFVISVASFVVGLIFIGIVVIAARRSIH